MVADFFLDPNIAYLFLVAGFSLAIMAILTPGTGLFEIGALFALLLAGWGVYNLPVNYWALAVLLLGVIPFILAVRRSGRMLFLVIALLALVFGSAYLFRGEMWWQPAVNPILALVVSLLMGGFFWIAIVKTLEAEMAPPSHDLGKLVGSRGEAKTDIHDEGSVQARGELWSAWSEEPIPEGSVVRILQRDGFLLKVEALEEEDQDTSE
ncbi:MAG: NfeD family protein [Anaerolineales bacterium]|jgi:membrane-bound serine protease (ClpP class)